jgi:hypothetical protein
VWPILRGGSETFLALRFETLSNGLVRKFILDIHMNDEARGQVAFSVRFPSQMDVSSVGGVKHSE